MRVLFGVSLWLGLAIQADAHAFLESSSPAVGGTVAAPRSLQITFTEPVEIALSGIAVMDGEGRAVTLGPIGFADDEHKVLAAGLPALRPGAYRVRWHVVSVDTHRTEGAFSFTVKR
jgi:methionine-rich copper-binding protein CopC